ncbi:M48 family metalloprotease [Gilvimarinus algae]|uniref:Putative beta-barrel assembly-enhancing protease n=1 Tax=Gilvimarinus algae TaxID=3058037 RepID=A0ABT8TF35_9GAMM|nr:M48 family metalloprotease [Gilvimarinus sp. SDUM040014]MDO3382694.1 M48 family metalloprotease [Gilvimarinus sp. SDUM040014]
MKRILACASLALGLAQAPAADELNLPDFGDTSSGIISYQEEKRLGELFMRSYRSQIPTSSDPLLIGYLETLIANLTRYSELSNRNFKLIVAENPTMNAFAAPGNIIGVHTGLLVYSQTEAQLASVLTHELAHLSQRHYARRLEQQRNMTLPFYTALLASLVLAASGSGDGGMAAMAATQAAAADAQLRFSRQNEQEADRIGVETLIQAGYDPYAAADMFEQMLRASRYSRRPPDFLLTHPVTESRVADARARAMRYPRQLREDSLEFHLMRARVRFAQSETAQRAVSLFTGELEGDSLSHDASRYGLALAYAEAGDTDAAAKALAPLLEKEPERLTYQVMDIDIDIAAERYETAHDKLQKGLRKLPNYYPFNVRYAEALMQSGHYQSCADFLSQYVRQRPEDPYLWYLLAEVNGLAGDVLGVHEARAEYFIQIGVYDKAMIQLRNALKLTKDDYTLALLNERLRYVEKLRSELDY